jgi:predicted O-linked N-acetylglucosamine transferase (SPINDLY family)
MTPSDAQIEGPGHKAQGDSLLKEGRLDDAAQCYRQAIALDEQDAQAHHKLGDIFYERRSLADAETCYRRALEIKPDFVEALLDLGLALDEQGRFADAEVCYRRAIEYKPNYALAHFNLGVTLRSQGRLLEAEECYQRALAIKPNFVQAHSNLLFCLMHNEMIGAQALFDMHVQFGEKFEAPLRSNWPQHPNTKDPDRRLQIGFVSGDLYDHAVASFFEPLLTHLAQSSTLSLHAYYNNNVEDVVTNRLRGYLKQWHPIAGLSDAAVAQRICEDKIDILIDLSGHTRNNRLLSFARKPAPVQASWMGYPGTTGLQAMDYYLGDRFFLPPGLLDTQFTEKIVHLPATAPFLPSEAAPPVNALPALVNRHVTLGSFNRMEKLGFPVIALWSQLLRAIPDARMLLAGMPKDGNNDTMIAWFAKEGIAQERLSFHPRSGMQRYLELHHRVDICLDAFPYAGGTTTLHALWMGVPTLTLAGHTPASRAGALILGQLGLSEFVALDQIDFVKKGLCLSANIPSLANLRAGMRERFDQSTIGQPAIVAAGMERALRIMWQRWCAGLPAESFEVRVQDIRNAKREADK